MAMQRIERKFIPCACGCNELILNYKSCHYIKFKPGHATKGKLNRLWNGGKKKQSDGYIYMLKPEHRKAKNQMGYVLEHILVYEECYKCCILSWCVVHHINEIRTDNRLENLQVMSRRQHQILHYNKKKIKE